MQEAGQWNLTPSRPCRAAPRSRRSSLFIFSDETVQAAQLFSSVLSAGGAGSFKRARALLRQTVQPGPTTELALQPSTQFNVSLEPPKEPRKGCSWPLLVAATVFSTDGDWREKNLADRKKMVDQLTRANVVSELASD